MSLMTGSYCSVETHEILLWIKQILRSSSHIKFSTLVSGPASTLAWDVRPSVSLPMIMSLAESRIVMLQTSPRTAKQAELKRTTHVAEEEAENARREKTESNNQLTRCSRSYSAPARFFDWAKQSQRWARQSQRWALRRSWEAKWWYGFLPFRE